LRIARLVTLVMAAGAFAAAGETVRIGGVEVPADSPLARKEHPRLLFTKAELPAIRERAKRPGVQADLKLIEQMYRKDPGRLGATTAAVAWVLTGKQLYRDRAINLVLSKGCGHYVQDSGLYAYDILYDELQPAERQLFQKKAVKYIKQPYRAGTRLCYAVGIWGDTDDAAIEKTIGEQAPLFGKWDSPGGLNWWAGSRGGDTRSFHYIHQNTMTPWANATMCWSNATGSDAWGRAEWARHMPMYYLYHLVPGFGRTVHICVNCNPPASPGDNSDGYFAFIAARWRNGPAQWYMDNVIHNAGREKHAYRVLPRYWGRLLWRDETLAAVAPEKLPESRYFDRMGFVSMRSGWDANATMAHFQCGPFEIWDGRWGRNNADNNSFLIMSRGGCMAADTGTRWGNNSTPSKHMQLYFNQTVAHNSITVGDEDIETPDGTAVRGGQVVPTQPQWLELWGEDPKKSYFSERRYEGVGKITAYASCPEWTYACGDASRSYSPDCVKAFTRQVLYIRPDTFVIFDRVESVKPELPKRWLLHTMEKPEPVGGEMKEVRPGYHSITGDTFTAAHMGGRLFCKSLIGGTIEAIGGRTHRFEVNGKNRDMPQSWYDKTGDRENFRLKNTFGEWRVEVTAKPGKAADIFLHVLHCADKAEAKMIDCRLAKVRQRGMVGVDLTVGGQAYRVAFAATGPTGGTIRVGRAKAEKLPSSVEDDYKRWSKDPRFTDWMTNDLLRPAIGEAEVDAWRKSHPKRR